MRNHMQTTFISIAVIAVLSGCAGSSSNPLDKYPGLKSAPPSDAKVESQTIAPPDLFDIEVNGSNEVNQGQFIEGQSSQTLIQVISKSNKIKSYKIEMTDFPTEDRPALVGTKDTNVFALQWTPPTGIIPGGQLGKSFKAQFLITVTAADNQLLVGLTKSQSIDVVVNRNNTQPQIIGYTSLKAGVDEGSQTDFTVDVEDLAGAGSPRLPEVQITPYIYANTEAYSANGSQYLMLATNANEQNPKKIGTNRYRFHYVLDIDRLPLNRDRLGHEVPASSTVNVCFLMRAVSAVSTLSDQVQICTVARYAVQPPTLTFNEDQLKAIKSGQDNTISFKATVEHPKGVVTLKSASSQIAGLSGTKSLSCSYADPQKQNELSCVLAWKPLCQKADSTKSLTLKLDNTLNSKTKTDTEVKTFNILADPAQCAKPKAGQS